MGVGGGRAPGRGAGVRVRGLVSVLALRMVAWWFGWPGVWLRCEPAGLSSLAHKLRAHSQPIGSHAHSHAPMHTPFQWLVAGTRPRRPPPVSSHAPWLIPTHPPCRPLPLPCHPRSLEGQRPWHQQEQGQGRQLPQAPPHSGPPQHRLLQPRQTPLPQPPPPLQLLVLLLLAAALPLPPLVPLMLPLTLAGQAWHLGRPQKHGCQSPACTWVGSQWGPPATGAACLQRLRGGVGVGGGKTIVAHCCWSGRCCRRILGLFTAHSQAQ